MRVLITGATGFVGGHLAAMMAARGAQITCLVRPGRPAEPLTAVGAKCISYHDVTDLQAVRQAVRGQQVVFHVAGRVTAVHPQQFYQANVEGTRTVAQACAEQTDPPVLVVVSSLAAAGPAINGRARTEEDPPQPVSRYGRSKLAAELAAAAYSDRVPITIVRPCIVFGQGDRATLDMFRSVVRYRVHLVPGFARHRYSLIHVTDLAELLFQAACCGRRVPSEVAEALRADPADTQRNMLGQGCYFAAYPQQFVYRQLGELIAEAAGVRNMLHVLVPMPIVWLISGVCTLVGKLRGNALPLNWDKAREIAAGSWVCSPQKAMEELGFRPVVPLAQRLAETVQWYRQQGWL